MRNLQHDFVNFSNKFKLMESMKKKNKDKYQKIFNNNKMNIIKSKQKIG